MSSLHLIIGNKNYSSWSLRPWLLLSAFGVPFAETLIPLSQPDTRERIAKVSPSGRVPVLMDGQMTVWDSLAICETVSERYLDGRGWPESPVLRAMARAVSAEMHSSFHALRNALPMNLRKVFPAYPITPAVQADIDRIQRLWQDCFEASDSREYLFGEFSIADCLYAPVVFRFVGYDVALAPACAAYVQRMLAHPAMQAWKAAALRETEVIPEDEV